LDDSGDANSAFAVIKGLLDHGWHLRNPDLGAPFGQQLYDFPLGGENLQNVGLRLLGLFSRDPFVVGNLWWLLGFPIVAAVTTWVLLRLGRSVPAAVGCGALYALVPYHFEQGQPHLYLSLYASVPVFCLLCIRLLEGEAPRLAGWRLVRWVALCALLGTVSLYYTVFGLVLLAFGGTVAVARRDADGIRFAAVTIISTAGALLLNLLPSAIFWRDHGRNPVAGVRVAGEVELYGLKIANLLLPHERHRLEPLARLKQDYLRFPLPSERGQTLGLVAACGLVVLLVVLVRALLSRSPRESGDGPLRPLSALGLVAVLTATIGGGASFISLLLTPQVRTWARMSVVVAFVALAAVAVLLDRLPRGRAQIAAVGLVVVIGFLDQTTPAFVPAYGRIARTHESDSTYVAQLERRLPAGAAVFQLPYVPFPEAEPPGTMADYEHFRPYVHSRDLRWSYGGVKGRPEGDWARDLDLDDANVIERLRAAGFSGVSLDRRGDPSRALERQLAGLFGSPAVESPDRRLVFFDLA
jgi:hypothetical protein